MLNSSLLTRIILLIFLSFSCKAENNDAPAKFYEDLRPQIHIQTQHQSAGKYYIVKPNESLSAIAARYGYNYIELAKWNEIAAPYAVFTGQRLKLFNPQKNASNPALTHINRDENTLAEQELEQAVESQREKNLPTEKSARYYTVQPNESLSAIAARYGYNYIKLAKWNQLAPPYNVLAGQRLQLFDDGKTENSSSTADNNDIALEQELEQAALKNHDEKESPAPITDRSTEIKELENVSTERYVVEKNDTLYSIALRFGMSSEHLAALNNLTSPDQLYAGQKLKILKNKQKDSLLKMAKNEEEIVEIPRDNTQKTSIISINNENMLKFYYQWPAAGKILKNFTQTGARGIEIGGEMGQVIRAAASGKVVAVSPGIYGHGGFIVIQHDEQNISSYANTQRSLVTNGQRVKQGQVIARMGQVGPKRPSLEFEIRKNGRLVDPLRFLPRKL